MVIGAISFLYLFSCYTAVVLMIGGNIPGITKVASVAIYDEVQSLNYGIANIYAAILLAFSFLILAGVYFINRRFVRTI